MNKVHENLLRLKMFTAEKAVDSTLEYAATTVLLRRGAGPSPVRGGPSTEVICHRYQQERFIN